MMDANRVVLDLQNSPYFRGIPPAVLHGIAVLVERREIKPDKVVVERGKPSKGMCMVASGTMEILRPGQRGEPVVTSRVGPGMWLGAAQVVEGGFSQSTWRSKERTVLWWFDDTVCRRLLGDLGQAGTAFRRALILSMSGQLLAANDFLRKTSDGRGKS